MNALILTQFGFPQLKHFYKLNTHQLQKMTMFVIRLRNLSMAAHPPHIREFFKDLEIPEGGVQIIGGEDGTAFILFNSDEDARRAMQLDGQLLCSSPVRLTLSSQAEMDKIIEGNQPASSVEPVVITTPSHHHGSRYEAEPYPPVVSTPPSVMYGGVEQEHLKYIECLFPSGLVAEHHLTAFFHPRTIHFIKIFNGPNDRFESAIIKFATMHEKNSALKMDPAMINNCSVKISSPPESYCKSLEDKKVAAVRAPVEIPPVVLPPVVPEVVAPIPAAYCLEVYGVSPTADYNSLGGFLGLSKHLKEQRLFLEMRGEVCKGRAFIDFETNKYEFEKVLAKDRQVFISAPLDIRPVPMRLMIDTFYRNKDFTNEVDFIKNIERIRAVVPPHKVPGAFQHKPRPVKSKVTSYVHKPRENELNGTIKKVEEKKKESSGSEGEKSPNGEKAETENNNDHESSKSPKAEEKKDETNGKEKAGEEERINKRKFCVRMANVAYHASNEDIQNFFKDIKIPFGGIVYLAKGPKKTGHVFIRLTCAEDALKAEKMHEKDFFGRSVLVKSSYVQYLKTIWERVLPGEPFPDQVFDEEAPLPQKPITMMFHEDIDKLNMNCINIRNLPSDCTETDIYNILKRDNHIDSRRIHIMRDPHGRCRGESFVELDNRMDCHRAVDLHEKIRFFGQQLQFFPIKFEDLQRAVGVPPPRPAYGASPYAPPPHAPPHSYYAAPQHAPSPYSPYEKRPRVEGTLAPPPSAAAPSPYSLAHKAPSSGAGTFFAPPPSSSKQVKMLGLSASVTQEDIIEFFSKFRPVSESIRLVFDKAGHVTGEGFLRFNHPSDARAAVETLNNRLFLNRTIKLQLD